MKLAVLFDMNTRTGDSIFKRSIVIVFFSFAFVSISAQTIEIGRRASEIKQLVEQTSRDRSGYDSYGNSRGNNVVWDVKYVNGKIAEVIQCFYEQVLYDMETTADFCKYYIMKNERLEVVLTQYENLSLSRLKEHYDHAYEGRRYFSELYFSEDFRHSSRVYLHENGLATVEWKLTNPRELSEPIRSEIIGRQQAHENAIYQKEQAEDEKMRRAKEIISQTYDLQEHAPKKYEYAEYSQRNAIRRYFTDISNAETHALSPTYDEVLKTNEKFIQVKNVYQVHYELQDHSWEKHRADYLISTGSKDLRTKRNLELISGTDESFELFKVADILLPSIQIEGYMVLTELTLDSVDVEFIRGITYVKVRKGQVEFMENPPPQKLQNQIKEKLVEDHKGKYLVKYDFYDIMGESDLTIISE